jgi:serine/threonine protein kinase/Tfp pilus assembly protein PilF
MSDSSQSVPETKDAATLSASGLDQSLGRARHDLLHSALAAILEKMADRWAAGQPVSAEQYLDEHPELKIDPESAVRVVYEEFCIREEAGEQVDSAEFYGRFPQWHDELAVVFQCHHLLHDDSELPEFPGAGQSLGELRLIRELGRGALGRVFLATQPSLSDRLLAVKITARRGEEHLSLARLQHTNIVPLYLVQDFPDERLRALCMPYLGGATWSKILRCVRARTPTKRSGRQIVECVADEQEKNSPVAVVSPAIGFLARSSFVDAVCWVGACLADALYYAHQRGLVHLDIKPSNVLLASDGQPMLLDFHLASEIDRLQQNSINRLGGTPGYMSPEQTAAANAIRRGTPITQRLDGRSDIYSLGVLLYESLTGELPAADLQAARRNLRQAAPEVSQGLEDIIGKCLCSAPKARYQDAAQLAADLRCHVARLPLRGVANRSVVERWQKWRRRKPHAMPVLAAGLAAAVMIFGIGGLFYRDRLRTAEAYLAQSQREMAGKDFAPAVEHAQAAWNSLHWFPWEVDLRSRLEAQVEVAQQSQAIARLHEFVEQLRFLDNEQLSSDKLAEIAAGCNKIWDARNIFAGMSEESQEQTHEGLDESLRRDLLDLAILSARMDVQFEQSANGSDADKVSAARRQALHKLDEAQQMCGSSTLLDLERRDYQNGSVTVAGNVSLDSLAKNRNAWEHYAVGRWLMHHGALAEAQREFAAAIDLQPDQFWANFEETRCEFDLGHFEPALTSATVCIALALAPQQAACFYNRAICYQSLGRDDEALADFARALQLDPTLAPAALARGVLFARLQRYAESKSDLESALANGSRPSDVYYQLARLSLAQHDQSAAAEWVRKSLAADPANSLSAALEKELAASAP